MKFTTEQNKAIVTRFNKEFIEEGNMDTFKELIDADVINHASQPGLPGGQESFSYFVNTILRKGFPDLKVEIHHQIAEGDCVTTRKSFHATHSGEFMGIPPTNIKVTIRVIDIIRLRKGKYIEHWGMSNLAEVMKELSRKA